MIWETLYKKAIEVQNARIISPFIEGGQVSAALLTKQGNIYVGVCIDTASGLGMCAERNAIANMITHGESQINKIVAVMPNGKVGTPCGACREFLMQLDENSKDIEILLDLDSKKTITLKELMPDWWGEERFIIDRIQRMEKHYEILLNDNSNKESYHILKEYMDSKQWLKDYEYDENHHLNIKRGVLSQDGLYNLLCEIEK